MKAAMASLLCAVALLAHGCVHYAFYGIYNSADWLVSDSDQRRQEYTKANGDVLLRMSVSNRTWGVFMSVITIENDGHDTLWLSVDDISVADEMGPRPIDSVHAAQAAFRKGDKFVFPPGMVSRLFVGVHLGFPPHADFGERERKWSDHVDIRFGPFHNSSNEVVLGRETLHFRRNM